MDNFGYFSVQRELGLVQITWMIVVPSFDTDAKNGFIFGIKAPIHQKSEFRTKVVPVTGKVSFALSYFISKNIKCNGINKIGN